MGSRTRKGGWQKGEQVGRGAVKTAQCGLREEQQGWGTEMESQQQVTSPLHAPRLEMTSALPGGRPWRPGAQGGAGSQHGQDSDYS